MNIHSTKSNMNVNGNFHAYIFAYDVQITIYVCNVYFRYLLILMKNLGPRKKVPIIEMRG